MRLTSRLRTLVVLSLVFSSACTKFHLEPTQANLGNHHVTIRPYCQGSSQGSFTQTEKDGSSRVLQHEFKCGDTMILIRENTLTVNGKSYGTLNEGDQIAVDYGKVRVNSKVREEIR